MNYIAKVRHELLPLFVLKNAYCVYDVIRLSHIIIMCMLSLLNI